MGTIANKSVGKPKVIQAFEFYLKSIKLEYVLEYKFSKDRKYRFDICIPSLKIGIEYEGIYDKSFDAAKYNQLKRMGVPEHSLPRAQKSGHLTISGYESNCTKYNLAQIEGWKVLRYTSGTYKDFYDDIKKIIIFHSI